MSATTLDRVRRSATLSAELGTAAALTAALEPALSDAALQSASAVSPLSLQLDVAPGARGALAGALAVEAWVERATRTLVFASAEARTADGALAAAASAVFRVDATAG